MLLIGEDGRRATRQLHETLCHSRAGRRWERIVRRHRCELESLIAVDVQLRAQVDDALVLLAAARTQTALDDATVAAVSRVLDGLSRRGGVELQREVHGFRDELAMARGHTLDEVLSPYARTA